MIECSADTPVRVFAAIPPSARTRVSSLAICTDEDFHGASQGI
jgi:hypothetical protein